MTSLTKASALLAGAAIAVAVFYVDPVDATCADPARDDSLFKAKAGFTTLTPVGPHPGIGMTVVAGGSTVEVFTTENLTPSGAPVSLTAAVQNTPNPVQLDTGEYAVFVGDQSGNVHRINVDPATGTPTKAWTKNLGRSLCDDSIQATPAVHLRRHASPIFRATFSDDLIYVPTRYSSSLCPAGANTKNKVYALNAADGSTAWTFNAGELVDVDIISEGGWLDPANDRLYVATERTSSPTQHSMWAIDTVTGTAAWSSNAGRLQGTPVIRGNTIYVGTIAGEMKALYLSDGSTRWTVPISGGFSISRSVFAEFRPPYADLIGAVDDLGRVWLVQDYGGTGNFGGASAWLVSLPDGAAATSRVTIDPANAKVYVGADDGKIHQLNLADGSHEADRVVDGSSPFSNVGDAAYVFEGADIVMMSGTAGGDLAKFCTPWTTEGAPVAPEGDSPETWAAPSPGTCSVDLDCGTEPPSGTSSLPCSEWKCVSQVCVADPTTYDFATCKDGNPDTSGDICYHGICLGKSECQARHDQCVCIDDAGMKVNRTLLTLESTMGERDIEITDMFLGNGCAAMGKGGPTLSGFYISLIDRDRWPFDSSKVVVTATRSGGGGATAPLFYDEVSRVTTPKASVNSKDNPEFVVPSKRLGTYYVVLLGPESGTPTSGGEEFVFSFSVEFTDDGGTQCINTKDGIASGPHASPPSVHEVKISVKPELPVGSGGCNFFGNTDETGHLFLTFTKSDGTTPIKDAKVQLGLSKKEFAFFSTLGNFLDPSGTGPDLSNIFTTNGTGQILLNAMGNNLNGTNERIDTFFVQIQCPGGGSTETHAVQSATQTIKTGC